VIIPLAGHHAEMGNRRERTR